MAVIRWGIVGCGDVTEIKSGPGFRKADNSALVAVMRRDARLAEDYARRHGVPRWYDDADALIADDGVDAVYIATPPESHKSLALKCAAAGKPALVEKPLAMNAMECRQMVEAFRARGLPLFSAFYRRAMPRFLTIRQMIEDGRIGDPRFVTIHHFSPPRAEMHRPSAPATEDLPWRFRPEVGGGGIFVDTGVHILDWLDFVFGPIVDVQGRAANQAGLYPAEDIVTASFAFASGVLATGTWCFSAHRSYERTRIGGTRGELWFSFFTPDPVSLITDAGEEVIDLPYPEHVHQPLIQTVVDELNGVGFCPSTGETGTRATLAVDAILGPYRSGVRAAAT
ncbi:MAG: Gfo/Idh/MocA family oxidoreductase [Rhodospirillaceae bacterium]|nr:Gfo/Idh/MocA family oxidoreductase [Rhodospirillaceae bacterium]